SPEPCIIISASGMAEFGRVLHHLANRIQDRRTTVLITGWQAPHTLGRRLVDRVEVVRIFGEEYHNNAHIEVINGFSGHADRDELLGWLGKMDQRPQQIYLVHGEEESAMALQTAIRDEYDIRATVPELDESVLV
ncbi:MAG: MBL fold metallo-hydrolase RNA specificity domain-containing protein, partial [Phototrophicaceae bacterium]